MAGVQNVHPLYTLNMEDWELLRDSYRGQRAIKNAGSKYLPPTKGMRIDGLGPGQCGADAYNAYLLRAVYHEFVKEAVETFIGMMWKKPPTINLPKGMEGMREHATPNGEGLLMLLRRINEEQLVSGRVGLLLDLPSVVNGEPVPYLAMYTAESIRNWDDREFNEGEQTLNLVVLDESGMVRQDDFSWKRAQKFRVLQLGDLLRNETKGTYRQGVFTEDTSLEYTPEAMITPAVRGAPLRQIPFVFINSKDNSATPDRPPLLGLANLALTVYRSEADYRQNLFMQGQDTLVIVGEVHRNVGEGEEPLRTGAGSVLQVEQGGEARYIGVNSQGLPEQRQALEADLVRAQSMSGRLQSGTVNYESGLALQVRIAGQTVTLNQIATSAAQGLEKLLRIAAEWLGYNPAEVEVKPNLEFADYELSGKDLVEYMNAKAMGAPISMLSIHNMMAQRGMTDMTYEQELDQITKEGADGEVIPLTQGTRLDTKLKDASPSDA